MSLRGKSWRRRWGGVFKQRNGRSLEGRTWDEMAAVGGGGGDAGSVGDGVVNSRRRNVTRPRQLALAAKRNQAATSYLLDPTCNQFGISQDRSVGAVYDDRKRSIRLARASRFFSSHSQMISTFHRSLRSLFRFSRSRSIFRASFGRQYLVRLATGGRWRRHECECQKHPRTSITLARRGNTTSGVPGRSDR